jgi:short-subunit dehydrogenase
MREYTAIITGGSRGIGKAIVEKYLEDGATVITCSRLTDNLLDLQKAVEGKYPGTLLTMAADMGQKVHVEAFAAFCLGFDAHPAVLIHNAGVFKPGSVLEEAAGTFETLMNTNVASAYHLSRAIIPAMVAKGRGHVFTICSTASITAFTNGGSYCISKFALLGMTKVLRAELKTTGVKVTAILPGPTYTDSWAASDLPSSRFMAAEDVADILFHTWKMPAGTVIEEIIMRPQEGDLS